MNRSAHKIDPAAACCILRRFSNLKNKLKICYLISNQVELKGPFKFFTWQFPVPRFDWCIDELDRKCLLKPNLDLKWDFLVPKLIKSSSSYATLWKAEYSDFHIFAKFETQNISRQNWIFTFAKYSFWLKFRLKNLTTSSECRALVKIDYIESEYFD